MEHSEQHHSQHHFREKIRKERSVLMQQRQELRDDIVARWEYSVGEAKEQGKHFLGIAGILTGSYLLLTLLIKWRNRRIVYVSRPLPVKVQQQLEQTEQKTDKKADKKAGKPSQPLTVDFVEEQLGEQVVKKAEAEAKAAAKKGKKNLLAEIESEIRKESRMVSLIKQAIAHFLLGVARQKLQEALQDLRKL